MAKRSKKPNTAFDSSGALDRPNLEREPTPLVMGPRWRPEFSDRRVELAYEIKAMGLQLTAMLIEAEQLGLSVVFNPYFDTQRGAPAVQLRVDLQLLR